MHNRSSNALISAENRRVFFFIKDSFENLHCAAVAKAKTHKSACLQ